MALGDPPLSAKTHEWTTGREASSQLVYRPLGLPPLQGLCSLCLGTQGFALGCHLVPLQGTLRPCVAPGSATAGVLSSLACPTKEGDHRIAAQHCRQQRQC